MTFSTTKVQRDTGSPAAPCSDFVRGLARETGADLLVAGSHGHSRLREWAFGGVTRSLFSESGFHRRI